MHFTFPLNCNLYNIQVITSSANAKGYAQFTGDDKCEKFDKNFTSENVVFCHELFQKITLIFDNNGSKESKGFTEGI